MFTPGVFFRELRADSTLQALFGAENIVHYQTVADSLHFLGSARLFMLESPLGDSGNEGGYSLCVTRRDWSEAAGFVLPEAFATEPRWRQIATFFDRWYAGAICAEPIDGLCLEVDVAGTPPPVPVPSLFFGVELETADETINTIGKGMQIFEQKISQTQRQLLQALLQNVGPACKGLFVGLMLSRPAAPLRLCTCGADLPAVLTAIKKIGINTLDGHPDWQEFLQRGLYCSHVDIDIGDTCGAKVGIEVKFLSAMTVHQQRKTTHWPDFMEWLVDKGWCMRQKSQAALNWTGGRRYCPDLFDFTGPAPVILRSLNHVKLDFLPNRPPQAKVYLRYEIG